MPKEKAFKVRVPQAFKDTVVRVAESRFTSESEIFREALLEYLQKRHIEIKETAEVPEHPPAKSVNYRDPKRRVSSSPKMDTDRKIAQALREGTSGQKPGAGSPAKAKK